MRDRLVPLPRADAANLQLLSEYTEAAATVCEDIYNHTDNHVNRLLEADTAVTDKFVLFPNKVGDRSQGFHACQISGGMLAVRQSTLDGDLGKEALLREARGPLMTLGEFVAASGALEPEHFSAAYAILRSTTQRLNPDPKFTKFAFHRIRRDLYEEYSRSRLGANYCPLEPDMLEPNIRAAWDVIGYPWGRLGKISIHGEKYLPRGRH